MQPARDSDDFQRAPVGKWVAAGTSIIWCRAPGLCGTVGWGRPCAADTRAALAAFDGIRRLAPPLDVVLDGSALEGIDPEALTLLIEWGRANLPLLRERVRQRVGVIPAGLDGVTLSGISPVLAWAGPVHITMTARDGFRMLLGSDGDALCDEVARLVDEARRTPATLRDLRALLRLHEGRLSLQAAVHDLAVPARSLQRVLAGARSSFRAEQSAARFRAAEQRLVSSDDKVGAIAARLGLSEAGLTQLVRARAGVTPTQLRRRGR
jgi:AraC-like DNA-binding protein